MNTLFDAEHTIALFGRPLALNELAKPLRRDCVLCRQSYERARAATHHLCPLCAEDLTASRARCEGMITLYAGRIAAHSASWLAQQAALDDDTAERWARLTAVRAAAAGAVQTYTAGRLGQNVGADERRARLTAAEARLAVVTGRIAATKAAGGLLAALIEAERVYDGELRYLQAESQRWYAALQECEAAAGTLPI